MVDLYWQGQGDVEVFHDTQRNIEYWPSERPHDVPEEAVEWYLSFEGWTRQLDDDDEEEDAESLDAATFIDANWQTVTAAIRNGEVDDRLAAIEAAERDRDNDARDSVLSALEARQADLQEQD